jgi:hypothetical protein
MPKSGKSRTPKPKPAPELVSMVVDFDIVRARTTLRKAINEILDNSWELRKFLQDSKATDRELQKIVLEELHSEEVAAIIRRILVNKVEAWVGHKIEQVVSDYANTIELPQEELHKLFRAALKDGTQTEEPPKSASGKRA